MKRHESKVLAVMLALALMGSTANAQAVTPSPQEQNRQLRHLSEVKDDFLRGVSHNLQTPLTSIRSNAEALSVTDHDARLTIIADQADRGQQYDARSLDGRRRRGRIHARHLILELASTTSRTFG